LPLFGKVATATIAEHLRDGLPSIGQAFRKFKRFGISEAPGQLLMMFDVTFFSVDIYFLFARILPH